jgi:hypothetical protein
MMQSSLCPTRLTNIFWLEWAGAAPQPGASEGDSSPPPSPSILG